MTALSKEEMTGYDITNGFKVAWGHFWHASHQSVYRELASLLKNELVSFTETAQDGKPDKKSYALTDKGRSELVQWLETPIKPKKVNDELLIKFFAGDVIEVKVLCDDARALQQASEQKLQSLLHIKNTVFADLGDDAPQHAKCAYLSLRKGILQLNANIQWCEEVLVMLDEEH